MDYFPVRFLSGLRDYAAKFSAYDLGKKDVGSCVESQS